MSLVLVVAVSPQGVIALDGKIPWYKPEDLKRFRSITMGSTLIMGRKTWDSLGRKLLPGRRTVVLTRTPLVGVPCASTLEGGLSLARDPNWGFSCGVLWPGTNICVVGGASVYEQALPLVSILDVTLVSDFSSTQGSLTLFEGFLQGFSGFSLVTQETNALDATLQHQRYARAI